jgi:hypothetical protein
MEAPRLVLMIGPAQSRPTRTARRGNAQLADGTIAITDVNSADIGERYPALISQDHTAGHDDHRLEVLRTLCVRCHRSKTGRDARATLPHRARHDRHTRVRSPLGGDGWN